MEDYIRQRQEYISRARSSFEEDAVQETSAETEWEVKGMRLRFVASVILFVLFFCWHSADVKFYEYTSTKIIDMIEENRYDKILQDYLKKGNIQ